MSKITKISPILISVDTIKWFSAGISVYAIGYMAFKIINKFLYKKVTEAVSYQNKKTEQRIQDKPTKKDEYCQFYFDKDWQAQLIQHSLGDPNDISLQTIYLHSPIIARDQFLKFTKQIRHRRRLVRKINEQQYIMLIINYEAQIDELLCRSRIQLTQYLKIDPDQFVAMEKAYDGEELRYLKHKAEQILKQKLVTQQKQKKMRNQIFFNIIEDQIAFVKNKMYERLHHNLLKDISLGQDKILKIVQALFEDIVYQKYGYQKEDIDRKIAQCFPSKNKIINQRNKLVKMMEADVGDFNYQSLQSLENENSEYEFKLSLPTAERSGTYPFEQQQ